MRVVDGDTIAVRARIWLGQEVETLVRVAGVDTPEKKGHCDSERELARQAQSFVEAKLTEGKVMLRDVSTDKYGGRVVARVFTPDGVELAQAILTAGLGHPYFGRTKEGWCDGGL